MLEAPQSVLAPLRLKVMMTCVEPRSTNQVDSSPLTITSRMHSDVKPMPVESQALTEVAVGCGRGEMLEPVSRRPRKVKSVVRDRQAATAAQAAAKLLSPPRRLSKSRRPMVIHNAAIISKRKCITAELLASAIKMRNDQPSDIAEGCGAEIVYINLSHRIDRRRSIEEQLSKHGLAAWRSEASRFDDHDTRVVTHTWDSTLSCKFDQAIMPARLTMSPGEIGCATSHAVLWHACAMRDDKAPPLLVLEDDVMLYANFCSRARRCVRTIERAFAPKDRRALLFLGAEVMQWRSDNASDKVAPHSPLRRSSASGVAS